MRGDGLQHLRQHFGRGGDDIAAFEPAGSVCVAQPRTRLAKMQATLAFYYIAIEQNVGWVANPTFRKI